MLTLVILLCAIGGCFGVAGVLGWALCRAAGWRVEDEYVYFGDDDGPVVL